MIFQIDVNKEVQFLFYLIPAILGIQIALYFFYQYQKIKDIHLPLNRVLLAFGIFIFFIIIGPLFIQISRNFIEKEFLHEIFSRIGWILSFFATIVFSMFILKKEFTAIINVRLVKLLIILNFIPILYVLFVSSIRTPIFVISIFFVVINGLYILRFQLIFIKRSVGTIKKKLRLFFIGTMISVSSILFAVSLSIGSLSENMIEIFYFLGVSILLIGFILISFAVYNFPPIYEFEWMENLYKLFIINEKNNQCLYNYTFFQNYYDKKAIIDPNLANKSSALFSSGILGIETIISLITGIRKDKINIIKQGDFQILLQHGTTPEFIVYVLIVRKELISAQHLLNKIKVLFEVFFKEILLNIDEINPEYEELFKVFENIMLKILRE